MFLFRNYFREIGDTEQPLSRSQRNVLQPHQFHTLEASIFAFSLGGGGTHGARTEKWPFILHCIAFAFATATSKEPVGTTMDFFNEKV